MAWLEGPGRLTRDIGGLLGGFCAALQGQEFPIARVNIAIHTLHPEVVGLSFGWLAGRDALEEFTLAHGEYDSPRFRASPLPVISRERRPLRRRLTGDAPVLDFPILLDLRAEGYTDYLALPIVFTDGRVHALAIASRAAGGFSDEQTAVLESVLPTFSLITEVHEGRRFASTLMETYLGRHTGERVLGGTITRGAGEVIPAALWYADLRDFTATSAEMSHAEVLALLNAFFDTMVEGVHAHGGEVLKFMGDGMLAIFPIRADCDRPTACRRALDGARAALDELARASTERVRQGRTPVRAGIALHVGEVVYGNIGSRSRLDFTVIGSAVNLVARIEGLCGRLGEPLLFSRAFADTLDLPVQSRGVHVLKGLRVAEEVCTVAGADA